MTGQEPSADEVASKRAIDLQFEEGEFVNRCMHIINDSYGSSHQEELLRKGFGDLFREMRGIKD